MKAKKIKKKVKKFIKEINEKYTSESEQIELIEEYYPGPKGLTSEEITAYDDFDSEHEFQFFVAKLRLVRDMVKQKSTVLSGEEIDALMDSGGTVSPL